MVNTWPTTAIQRSSISCCRFLMPAAASADRALRCGAAVAVSGRRGVIRGEGGGRARKAAQAALVACHIPASTRNHEGQTVPGQCVDQVAVMETDHRHASARPTGIRCRGRSGAWYGRQPRIDEEGGSLGQLQPMADGRNVARVPALLSRGIGAQKTTVRLAHAHQALDSRGGGGRGDGGGHRLCQPLGALLLRHKTPVHQHLRAIIQLQGRHHPEARAQLGQGLGKHGFLGQPPALRGDGQVFVAGRTHLGPLWAGGQGYRSSVHALIDALDQRELPCVAGVGVGCSGIMFAFMWNMTHSVPAMAMATNTTVKMVDSMVQPPSTLPFMCRKYTMCTRIWITAKPPSTSTAVLRSAMTLAMTSQKGMAVRMTESTKPIV